jgi:CBS domain-containing protein
MELQRQQTELSATGHALLRLSFEVKSRRLHQRSMAMKVKSCMHKGVEWVSPDTPLKTLANTMREQDIGAIPIGENDRLVGMVTDRDITIRAIADGNDISVLTSHRERRHDGGDRLVSRQ